MTDSATPKPGSPDAQTIHRPDDRTPTQDQPTTAPPTSPPHGVVQLFDRWITTEITPFSLEEDRLDRVALYEPRDIPAMIEIINDAERCCLENLRRLYQIYGRPEADGQKRNKVNAITCIEMASVSGKIRWLHEVRQCLKEQAECSNVGRHIH